MTAAVSFLILLGASAGTVATKDERLKPFKTDYCTGFSEGTSAQPQLWKHCCVEHDLYFWAGGCAPARKRADLRLYDCVKSTGAVKTAWLMYAGIRLGSFSPIKIDSEKWGNAWKDGHGIKESLSEQDVVLLESMMNTHPSADVNRELQNSFLLNLRKETCQAEGQKTD